MLLSLHTSAPKVICSTASFDPDPNILKRCTRFFTSMHCGNTQTHLYIINPRGLLYPETSVRVLNIYKTEIIRRLRGKFVENAM